MSTEHSTSLDANHVQTDLQCCPWRRVQISGSDWLLKSQFTDNFYEVLFSDQINIWQERLQRPRVEQRSKQINPSLEIEPIKLMNHIQDGLMGLHSETQFTLAAQPSSNSSDELVVTMSFRLSGLPFCWMFHTLPASNEQIHMHLTQPLMAMVCELTQQRRQLFTLLHNKDKEITDLKSRGATVSRKKLQTAVFDEASFCKEMCPSKDFVQMAEDGFLSAFSAENQVLYCDIMTSLEQQKCRRDQPLTEGLGDCGSCSGASSATTSPVKPKQSDVADADHIKLSEHERRAALEKRLAEEDMKNASKKKKKIKF